MKTKQEVNYSRGAGERCSICKNFRRGRISDHFGACEEIEALVAELRNGFSLSGSGKPRFPVPVMEKAADALLSLSRQLEKTAVRVIEYMEGNGRFMVERADHVIEIGRLKAERDAAYAEGAEAMREEAAKAAEIHEIIEGEDIGSARDRLWHNSACHDIASGIRALPLPQRR